MRLPALAATVALAACASTRQSQSAADAGVPLLSTTQVIVEGADGRSFSLTAEVAATPSERARGLMFRKSLDPERGMIFLFPEASQQSFWMHNTLIPLDMLFIAEDGSVVGVVQRAEPLTDAPRMVPGISKYVLEVIGGWCADRGISRGARVTINGLSSLSVR